MSNFDFNKFIETFLDIHDSKFIPLKWKVKFYFEDNKVEFILTVISSRIYSYSL